MIMKAGDRHAAKNTSHLDGMPQDRPRPDHPTAAVPDRLFDDLEADQRWRRRFTAVQVGLPRRARDEPDRTFYTSNATGRTEVWCWHVTADRHVVATDRPDGTTMATLSADGSTLWWFDDHAAATSSGPGARQPFGTGPTASAAPALPDVPPGYPAGLEVGRRVVLAGFADDDGSRIHLVAGRRPRRRSSTGTPRTRRSAP